MAALCWWDEEEERHWWARSAKGRGPGRESIQGLVANGPDWPVGSAAWAMKASWVAKKSKKKTVGCHGDWAEKMKENRKMFFFWILAADLNGFKRFQNPKPKSGLLQK
jgi:hypothetical protein